MRAPGVANRAPRTSFSRVAKWKGGRLLTDRAQVRILPLEPRTARTYVGRWAQIGLQIRSREVRFLHGVPRWNATLRIWDAGRLSTGRDGFDSRTWRRTCHGSSAR